MLVKFDTRADVESGPCVSIAFSRTTRVDFEGFREIDGLDR